MRLTTDPQSCALVAAYVPVLPLKMGEEEADSGGTVLGMLIILLCFFRTLMHGSDHPTPLLLL